MTEESVQLTPEMLLAAYANGYFPMAMERDDPELYWFSPEERGVLPLDNFNVPRGLKRSMKDHEYTITVDQDFESVIRACGAKTKTRDETWINETIVGLYTQLHKKGHAHSIEVWQRAAPASKKRVASHGESPRSAGGMGAGPHLELVGGLYGVSLGAAFFGESMFSRATDASKIALIMLVKLLREAGYQLLDTQYVNDHLKQFGVLAIAKKDYMMKLEKALSASDNPSSRFSTVSVRSGAASASSLSKTFES